MIAFNGVVPAIHDRNSVYRIMFITTLSTLPALIAACYFWGYGPLIQVLEACFMGLLFEGACIWLRAKPILNTLKDGSALLTALLLGLSLPPLTPWWVMLIAIFFAIVIAKQLYGGLGENIFNPAMVGYAVVLIAFPVELTSWPPPSELLPTRLSFLDTLQFIFTSPQIVRVELFDSYSYATPLTDMKTKFRNTALSINSLNESNNVINHAWFMLNSAFLIGGVTLLWQKVINWHIPISFLLSLALFVLFGHFANPLLAPSFNEIFFSGATLFCAFFIATDPISAATTIKGRILYGAGIGFLVWLLRQFSHYPDGIAFAVLIMNACVPLIDHYTQPTVYGHK